MKKWAPLVLIIAVVVVGLSWAAGKAMLPSGDSLEATAGASGTAGTKSAKATGTETSASGAGAGLAAIKRAAEAKKYLFLFFWKEENEPTRAMKQVFEAATKMVAEKADSVAINITDPAEDGIVEKFQLDRAPMPLALALASNGAVMGGFPTKFTDKELLDAFGTPCTERCMKALQENKLVLLCVQNKTTKSNDEAMQGVRAFKADEQFARATEIVMLDPTDPAESPFLSGLKIDPKTPEAVTAFLAPPGAAIAEFTGATDKAELVSALQKASSGACAGGTCGPNGCPPKQ